MRIIITAIGSMSAECVISRLKETGNYIVGCDIYPGEWHYETTLCDAFERAPLASNEEEYIAFLINTCQKYDIQYLIPLTDLEIDVINNYRLKFEKNNLILCMPGNAVLTIARNKFKLWEEFKDDDYVPSIQTSLLTELPFDFTFPCIAKPYNGRSSEGLLRNATKEQVMAIKDKNKYIVQEQLEGDIFTVDYCRCAKTKSDVAIPRQELLRTKNGAGLTIKITPNKALTNLASYIGNKLNINGCINMEFIRKDGKYYLIDINPRFSAGVAFSHEAGYDMVTNHIRCYQNKEIENIGPLKENIMTKKYKEIVIC